MRILVTGANGFVGSWLIRELVSRGHDIIAVVKDENEDISSISFSSKIEIVYSDLSELLHLPDFIAGDVDAVFHLAWIAAGGAGRADYKVQLKNVHYACDVVEMSRQMNVKKILFAGTISEETVKGILERDTVATNNIYGICKLSTHYLVDVLCKKAQIDYVWMQFSNLFGPQSINGNIVGYTLTEILNGREAKFGPANQPYDLFYIEDLVRAMSILCENRTAKHSYYLGSGQPRVLSDFLNDIGQICGHPELIKIGVRPDDGLRYEKALFDNSSLEQEFGFQTSVSFESAVLKTLAWLKEYNKL